jgi:hypothetical protein
MRLMQSPLTRRIPIAALPAARPDKPVWKVFAQFGASLIIDIFIHVRKVFVVGFELAWGSSIDD